MLKDTRSIYKNQLYIYILTMSDLKCNLEKNPIYITIKKNKIVRTNFIKGSESIFCQLQNILKEIKENIF